MKNFFATPPRGFILVAGFLLVFLLGGLDFLTGLEISFSVFYLLPVYLVTWFAGRWSGVSISFASAGVWLLADLQGHVYSHPLVPYWNMAVRLLFFLVTTYLLSELRRNLSRRRALERIFFHDVLNLLGGIRGLAEFLKEPGDADKGQVYDAIHAAAEQSIDQIEAQQILTAAEIGDLPISLSFINSREVLEQTLEWLRFHGAAKRRSLRLDEGGEAVIFESDQGLVSRILGNMIKNALEASRQDEIVTAGCAAEKDTVKFWVHNPGVIPKKFRSWMFRKNFTTKGKGRGLGTYSMKLLSEKLGGKVGFHSTEERGTTFFVRFPRRFS